MDTVGTTVDLLQLIGEATRVRLLALLSSHELTVAEIVSVTQLAQSSVSTHLGKLRDAGLVRDRKAGASTFYAINDAAMPAAARKVWDLVHNEVRDSMLQVDRDRSEKVVRARDEGGARPELAAGEMERNWSPGRTWEALARAMAGLVRVGDTVDIGCGDGNVAQILAPRATSWTCVDRSERMLGLARERLQGLKHVRFISADAQDLPFEEGSFDAALMFHVLTQVASPMQAIGEAMRVLRPCGTLVVVTLDAHDREDETSVYGDMHPGFAPGVLRRMLVRNGLAVDACNVSCRDKRTPHVGVVTAFASKARRLRGKP